ncbi:Uncharacterised protein [Vibrio cholerae]|nr:Uncharacterised protein [Vibrio cholerae]
MPYDSLSYALHRPPPQNRGLDRQHGRLQSPRSVPASWFALKCRGSHPRSTQSLEWSTPIAPPLCPCFQYRELSG